MLASTARNKDSCRPHVAARLQRTSRGGLPRRSQESKKGLLSRIERPSSARSRETSDDWFRINDHLRNRLSRERSEDPEAGARMLASRVAWRSRNPYFPS